MWKNQLLVSFWNFLPNINTKLYIVQAQSECPRHRTHNIMNSGFICHIILRNGIPWRKNLIPMENMSWINKQGIQMMKSQVNNNLFFFGREKCGLLLCIYCMQMSRLEPWSTIAAQLLIEYLCNMNHNRNIRPLQQQPALSLLVLSCLVVFSVLMLRLWVS